ncbi:MAG: hypothetical protein G3M78_05870 [Candidatus Nitrohelix vancouverensis]|uniref:Uncharacterized protein n=1 Tax=Candidatus Nitrohelix vancouverensis TaxID=2705534 RepID=A0A7T0C1P9_9BACT|nr:MAG: hypothetical protein G3M78_05870 [Candidatus Nitrohelix vancouverensis]
MSKVKISELDEAPPEGIAKQLQFEHPLTYYVYEIGLIQSQGTYFAITDKCRLCGGSLGKGILMGKFVLCDKTDCAWNMKSGICKSDRTNVTPTYKVIVEEDGLYINI